MKKSERAAHSIDIGRQSGPSRQVSHLHAIDPRGAFRAGARGGHPPAPPSGRSDLAPGVAHETRRILGDLAPIAPPIATLHRLFARAKSRAAVSGWGGASEKRNPGARRMGSGA